MRKLKEEKFEALQQFEVFSKKSEEAEAKLKKVEGKLAFFESHLEAASMHPC